MNMAWRSRSDDNTFNRLDDPMETNTRSKWGHETHVKGGRGKDARASDISLAEMNVPEGGIRVKDEVVVTSSDWLEYRHEVF